MSLRSFLWLVFIAVILMYGAVAKLMHDMTRSPQLPPLPPLSEGQSQSPMDTPDWKTVYYETHMWITADDGHYREWQPIHHPDCPCLWRAPEQ